MIERASVLPAPHAFAKPEEFKDAGGATVLAVSSLQEAAYHIDTHAAVDSFAKNAGLGFAIPYLHNGQPTTTSLTSSSDSRPSRWSI